MRKIVFLAVLAATTVVMSQGYKRHFHIHQTSLTSFVVTCDNGADPTMAGKESGAITVSCGEEK